MHFARDVSSRVFIMDGGNWVEEGTPEEMFTNPKEERSKQFLAHILKDIKTSGIMGGETKAAATD
jgi:ABC-type polar amino acid transport system ATPase subunit